MLTTQETTPEMSYHNTYSFESRVCHRKRSALYRQALSRIGNHKNGVIIEIAPSELGHNHITASVNLCSTEETGLLPRLFPLIQVETAFGRDQEIIPLPWENNSFETLICIDAFSQFSDHSKALLELRRILKPGGKAIFADQWFRHLTPLTVNLLNTYQRKGGQTIWSSRKIARLLSASGFGEIEFEVTGSNNYICTATAI
jgi:SAM-dependent methyltransferase